MASANVSKVSAILASVHTDMAKCIVLFNGSKPVTTKLAALQKATMGVLTMVNDIKAKLTTKHASKLVKQIPNLTYTRLPQVHVYGKYYDDDDDDDDEEEVQENDEIAQQLFTKLASQLQVGDIIMPRIDQYRGNGVYIVDRTGKMGSLIGNDNAEICVPAWALELGMNTGLSFEKLKKLYGTIGAMCLVYPKSMQDEHLHVAKSGSIESVLLYNYIDNDDVVLTDETDGGRYEFNNFTSANVFLKNSVDSKSKPKSPSKAKTLSSSKAKALSSSSSCAKQTTKKYTERPSPPFPAAECPGSVKKGNNGKMYESIANVKGVYAWKLKK